MGRAKVINEDSSYYSKVGIIANEGKDSYAIDFKDEKGEKYFGKHEILKYRIYSPWAFSKHEKEKARINREIYNEIRDKAKLNFIKSGYAIRKYEVISNPENLSTKELALIADTGNLCFGYRTEGDYIIIHTD